MAVQPLMQQPQLQPPQISPDGMWRWDGRQWVPNQPVIVPKNPALSLIVSFFLPGVGSMINGDVGTGVAILVLFLVGITLAVVLIGIPMALGAWTWGLIDAYQGAQRWNRVHGILS